MLDLSCKSTCLEGRYSPFHRSHAAKPFKIATSRVSRLCVINEAGATVGCHFAQCFESPRTLTGASAEKAPDEGRVWRMVRPSRDLLSTLYSSRVGWLRVTLSSSRLPTCVHPGSG